MQPKRIGKLYFKDLNNEMINFKHCLNKPDAKPCWVCLHGRYCIGGLYCLKRKQYVQYQNTINCPDKEMEQVS